MLMAWFSNSDWLDDKKTTLFLTVAVASGRYGRHVEASANLAYAVVAGGERRKDKRVKTPRCT